MRQLGAEFGDEGRIVLVLGIGVTQLGEGVGQRLAGETAAIGAKVTVGIGLGLFVHQDWGAMGASAARTAATKR